MVMARMISALGGHVSMAIAASVRSPDIAALARARGWNGSGQISCTINAGVDVASLNIAGIPHDSLTIINRGRIGGVVNGGTAIYTRIRIRIDNTSGTIFGGGGAGGNGAWKAIFRGTGYVATGNGGSGGSGAGFNASGALVFVGQTSGNPGTSQSVGGPSIGGSTQGTATGGRGGDGGAAGMPGANGNYGSTSGTFDSQSDGAYGMGGAAGAYVDGNSFVTWIGNGTRLGNAIN